MLFQDTLVNLKGTLSSDRDELNILKEERKDYQEVCLSFLTFMGVISCTSVYNVIGFLPLGYNPKQKYTTNVIPFRNGFIQFKLVVNALQLI